MIQWIRNIFSKGAGKARPANENQISAASQSPVTVKFDKQGIECDYKGGAAGSVTWNEIDLVAIRIEDEFLPFPYWYIGREGNLLRIPNDANGGKELFFDGLSEYLDGYRCDETFKTIIAASSAMEGSFIVWRPNNA